jgi:hypothetical protein
MRRTIIALTLLLATSLVSKAQDDKKFRFGLHGTPIVSWMRPDTKEYESDGNVIRFSYGLSAELIIEDNYTFATGLDILSAGGKLLYPHEQKVKESDPTPTSGTLSRTYIMQYIQVPITIKMRSNEIGYFRFYGQFGIGNCFKLSAKADDEFEFGGSTGGVINEENKDISEEVNFYKASLMVGGGIEYSLGGSTALTAGLIYNNGFTDVLSGQNSKDTELNENATMNYLEVKLGIIF